MRFILFFTITTMIFSSCNASKLESDALQGSSFPTLSRHLFQTINQETHEKSAAFKIRKCTENDAHSKFIQIFLSLPTAHEDEWDIIFTRTDETPRLLYHRAPNKVIKLIRNDISTVMRFERLIGSNLILWSHSEDGQTNSRRYHLYSLETGEDAPLEHPSGFWRILFNNHLVPTMLIQRSSLNQKKFFIYKDGGFLEPIADKDTPRSSQSYAFHDSQSDSTFFFSVSQDQEEKTHTEILLWDQARNRLLCLAKDVLIQEDDFLCTVVLGDSLPLYAFKDYKEGKTVWRMAPALQFIIDAMQKKIRKDIGETPFIIENLDASDHQTLAFRIGFDREPPRQGTFNLGTRKITWHADTLPCFDDLRLKRDLLCPMDYYEIRARDGLTIPTLITLPQGSRKPFPTIFLIHGGPYDAVYFRFSPLTQLLANRGFALISPNFRGSSYNIETAFHDFSGWGKKMQSDLHDAIEWAIEQGIADPKRVGFWGGSYGGYATLMEACTLYVSKTFPGIACASSFSAPTSCEDFIEDISHELGEENEILKTLHPAFCSGTLDYKAPNILDELEKISPTTYAHTLHIPLMIGHGLKDGRVPVKHSIRFSSLLKEKKIPHIFATFEAPHELEEPRDILADWALQENFFCHHLGLNAEPFKDALKNSSLQIVEGADLLPGLEEAVAH